MIRQLGSTVPIIHENAFVSEAAYIVGDVEICEGASIWPGAVIRGDMGKILIGKNTCVQDNSVVHGDNDVSIGEGVVIGHRVLCHAAFVGDSVLIGSGSTVNDGVKIGKGSLIASGAVIIDNMEIPDSSLVVGMPARIKGSVLPKHSELIQHTAKEYVNRGVRYRLSGNLDTRDK